LGDHIARYRLSSKTGVSQDVGPVSVVDELVGKAKLVNGGIDAGAPEILANARTDAADPHTILKGDHEPVVGSERNH
jgi:hypothetical protein